MNGKLILNKLSPYKQGMQISEVQKKYNLEKIVKLASNENPYGCSKSVTNMFLSIQEDFEFYPDGYASKLRTALAKKLQVNEEQLVFGSGSDEIVQMISRAFLYPGVNTIMSASTFPQYKHNALIEGAEIIELDPIDGYHDLDGMLRAIDDKTAVIFICSPDNPTGTLIPEKALRKFMDQCPKDVVVVLDEAYYEYVDSALRMDSTELLKQYDNLIILRTFSKAYGLASFRIGYGVAHINLANKLNIVRPPFNTTPYAQEAALIALKDTAFLEKTVSQNNAVKRAFEQFLDQIGWHYYHSHTNFILVSTPISGMEVFEHLLKKGFIIRPGELLGYPNTVRITIGNDSDMKQLQNLIYQLDLKTNKEIQK